MAARVRPGVMKRLDELRREIGLALAALEVDTDERGHDGWLDPGSLTAAVEAGEAVLLRVAPPWQEVSAEGRPEPRDPWWLLLGKGAEVRLVPMRLVPEQAAASATAIAVVVEIEPELCCDARRCDQHKSLASVWLQLEGGAAPERVLVAEHLGPAEAEVRAAVAPLAKALARRLAVPLDGAEIGPPEAAPPAAPRPPERGGLPAMALARWSLRREGEVFVLRDHATRGPREAAAAEGGVAVALGALALTLTYFAVTAGMQHAYQRLALVGIVAAVLAAASYAMMRIAAHSRAYRPRHAALLTLARDRLVLSPWHSRTGAVSPEPEGRFGAAVRIAEIERLHAVAEGERLSLRYETAHGPFEVGLLEDAEQARAWIAALERFARQVVHAEAARKVSPAADRRAHEGAVAAATLVLLACLGCQGASAAPGLAPLLPAARTSAPVAFATAVASTRAPEPAAATAAARIELIEDDLPRALQAATQAGKVVFVEVWAPWCHTCLSMKSFVLADAALVPLAERVVFAAIDSDRPEGADFVDRYQVDVWPTLYVLEPRDQTVLGMWQGAASVEELRSFVTDAVDARDAKLEPASALASLLEAKRAHADGKFLVAARHYGRALERGGEGWARRSEALYGLLFSEYKQGHWGRCAQIGSERIAEVTGAAVPADYASLLMSCARRVTDAGLRGRALDGALERLARHTAEPPTGASVDDRSDAWSLYATALQQAGDRAAAREVVGRQLRLLEQAAAQAPSPEAAATFDYARLTAYLSLGRGEEAVAMLSERVEQLPDGYEAWARLAEALSAVGRARDALAPATKAVELSYGPRKLRYLALQARLFRTLGDAAAERRALEQLVRSYDSLDEPHRRHPAQRELVDEARARLRALPAASAASVVETLAQRVAARYAVP